MEEATTAPRRSMKVVKVCESETDDGASCDGSPSPLMILPKELWTLIFNYVPQADRMTHREVNKEWCKNTDEFSTVDVNFNADYPPDCYRQRVFDLRIRSCTFSSLHVPFSPDFKNPLLVKEITFTTRVAASNVLKILSVCTNIESLRFLTTMSSETAFEDTEETTSVFNNLKNLQYLEIGILTFLDRNKNQESRTFKSIIGNENVVFSSLRALNIAFLVRHREWFQIFQFLSRHSVTLKNLNMICPCGDRLGCNEDRKRDPIVTPDILLPQLHSFTVNGASDCACREDIWVLLDQQTHLRRFDSDISRGLSFMTSIIEKNQETIRTLKLHDIRGLFKHELDCSVLSKCANLQELSLFIAGDCGCVIVVNVGSSGPVQHCVPILSRLESLPKSLRRLTLCGSQILTEDLEKLLCPGRVLEEVTLGRANSMNLKMEKAGMTVQVLKQTLENLGRLKKFRIFLDMICESESAHVESCGELSGVWGKVFEMSKELYINGHDAMDKSDDARCCGETYSHEACLHHSPYIDMVFRNVSVRKDFLERVKQLCPVADAVAT